MVLRGAKMAAEYGRDKKGIDPFEYRGFYEAILLKEKLSTGRSRK